MMNEVRWGILGTAKIARTFIKAMAECYDTRVQAVASREYTRALEWAKEQGIPRVFGSYQEMLDSAEIDCVYNPLPNSLHAEWTIKALEAGLPVLCEKPFAANAAEARRVADVAAQKRLPLGEAFMYRYHPQYDRIFGLIQDGALGVITTIRSAFSFRMHSRDSIIADAALAGGSLMDVGCYCVNLSRLVAGAEPIRVAAFERRTSVDDLMLGILEFPNNILAHLECGIESYARETAEIEGADGSILIPSPWLPGNERATFLLRRGDREEVVNVPAANSYALEIEDFVRACRTRDPLRWSIEDAIANMRVIDALYESARAGAVVTV